MSDDLTKTAATSFTAGIGEIGQVSATASIGAQVIPANTTINAQATLTIPKSQAISNLRLNFGALSSTRGLTGGWYLVPQTLSILDTGSHPGTITQTYNRTSGQLSVNLAYRAGSGGFTMPAHTVSLIATFYQLPF